MRLALSFWIDTCEGEVPKRLPGFFRCRDPCRCDLDRELGLQGRNNEENPLDNLHSSRLRQWRENDVCDIRKCFYSLPRLRHAHVAMQALLGSRRVPWDDAPLVEQAMPKPS